MLDVSVLPNGELKVRRHIIANIKQPYKRLIRAPFLLRTPAETLGVLKVLPFHAKINERTAGALYTTLDQQLPCQYIYRLGDPNSPATTISPIYLDKMLTRLFLSLHEEDSKTNTEIKHCFKVVIQHILQTHPFTLIYTNLAFLPSIISFPNIMMDNARLTSVSSHITRYVDIVRGILREHGDMPLGIFDGNIYNSLQWRNTTLKKADFSEHENVLILVGTNTHYAGFLTRQLLAIGVKNVLPVALFRIPVRERFLVSRKAH